VKQLGRRFGAVPSLDIWSVRMRTEVLLARSEPEVRNLGSMFQ
jgi:hypothetical protein